METLTYQVGVSQLTLSEDGLNLMIPRQYWTPRQWERLVTWLTRALACGLAWVTAPATIATTACASGQPLRWKQIAIDGLSYLVFVLLIPPNHPLRRLYAAFDWRTIDERCATAYKNQDRGAPAYPPQMLFRILVLMFVSGTPFESATLQRLATDMAWRWFVGLGVFWPTPDASSLSRFRKRLGMTRFEAILVELIQVCDAHHLIGHQESYYDMTGVAASAHQVTPYERAVILAKAMSAYLEAVEGGVETNGREQIAALALEVLGEKHPSLQQVKPAQVVASQTYLEQELAQGEPGWWKRLQVGWTQVQQSLGDVFGTERERLRAIAHRLAAYLPQAYGNPDAAVGHTRADGTLCGYRSGFLVDAKRRIITAVVVVALNCVEAPTVGAALDKHYAIFRRYPRRLGLDSAFDRDEVHQALETHAIYGSITVRSRPGPVDLFHADAFTWNVAQELVCPNGKPLERVGGPYKDGRERYRAVASCAGCPFLARCLSAKQRAQAEPRRQLEIVPAAHRRAQRSRERSRSPEGRALRRRRFATEGLFGHLNTYHNGDKAPYRNGEMDTIAQLMVAFVSNLEVLARYA